MPPDHCMSVGAPHHFVNDTCLHQGAILPCGKQMKGLPEGVAVLCNDIGYMKIDAFQQYLEFFDRNTKETCGTRADG